MMFQRRCFLCGDPLKGKRAHKGDYCSGACRQRAYRIRKRNGFAQGELPKKIPPKGRNKVFRDER